MVWHACQNSAIGLIRSNKLLKSIGAHERGENYLIKTALSWHCVGKGFRKGQGITIIAIPPPLHHFDVLDSSFGPTLWRISPFPQCSAELAWQDSAPLKPSNWILFFMASHFIDASLRTCHAHSAAHESPIEKQKQLKRNFAFTLAACCCQVSAEKSAVTAQ